MNETELKAIKVEDVISTKWDDEESLITGQVRKIYRGHRGLKFVTLMKDGETEVVNQNQIVNIYNKW